MKNSLSRLLNLIGAALFMTVFAAADVAAGPIIFGGVLVIVILIAIVAVVVALLIKLIKNSNEVTLMKKLISMIVSLSALAVCAAADIVDVPTAQPDVIDVPAAQSIAGVGESMTTMIVILAVIVVAVCLFFGRRNAKK